LYWVQTRSERKVGNVIDMTIYGNQVDQVLTMHCHNYHPQWWKCVELACVPPHDVLHSCFAVATRIQPTDSHCLRRCGTLHELLTFTPTEWVSSLVY